MERFYASAFGFMVLFVLLSATALSQTVSPNLNIIISSQNPYPVEPGKTVELEVEVQNAGLQAAQNVVLEIVPNDPFTLQVGEAPTKTFVSIAGGESSKATFKLVAARDASSNTYDVEFRYYTGTDSTSYVSKKLSVTVQGTPNFVIKEIVPDPSPIKPGDIVGLKVTIQNVGTGSAHYVQAVLTSDPTYINPVLGGGEDYVGDVLSGGTQMAEFRLSIDTAAEYKTYAGTIKLDYKDDSNTDRTESFAIGIPVRGTPLVEVLSTQVDGSDLKVDVENVGTGTAKALIISLLQNGQTVDISIANELKASKHQTIRFSGWNYGSAIINMTYLDEENKYVSQQTPLTIKQATAAKQQQGSSSPSLIDGLLIMIIVIETFFLWRTIRKNRKK